MKSLVYVLIISAAMTSFGWGKTLNGFDLTGAAIPEAEIHQGGPPRDGIPSIDHPRFVSADRVDFLAPQSLVMGVNWRGEAKAYPLAILNWHEVVNDEIGGDRVAVTYCPLCGTGVVYRAPSLQQALNFGVSGLLYNSDVLLYDRQTESLWSQLLHKAVSGPLKGQQLEMMASQLVRWDHWLQAHPATQVLSTNTGFSRDYSRNPYSGYDQSPALYFPVAFTSRQYHPKERVLGLEYRGEFKAYPFVELGKAGNAGVLVDRVGGELLTIEYDLTARTGLIKRADGSMVASINAFWFAWFTFHPDTQVFTAPE